MCAILGHCHIVDTSVVKSPHVRIRATNAAPHVTDCSRAAPASSRAALILSAWARGCRPVCHPLSATWPDRPAAERATRAASREPPPPRRRRRRRRRRHGRACHGRLPARLSRPVIVSGARLSRPHLGSTARHRPAVAQRVRSRRGMRRPVRPAPVGATAAGAVQYGNRWAARRPAARHGTAHGAARQGSLRHPHHPATGAGRPAAGGRLRS